jgi:predicted protein tyrosine phosphatase
VIHNCYWVEPGRLLAGEYPSERIRHVLAEAGITACVDLTEAGAMGSYDELLPGVAHHSVPIGDFGVPADPEMTRILDLVDRLLADGERVYVHCAAGIGRTGTVVGCYLVRHGTPNATALARLAELREPTGSSYTSPEMPAQRALIERWR